MGILKIPARAFPHDFRQLTGKQILVGRSIPSCPWWATAITSDTPISVSLGYPFSFRVTVIRVEFFALGNHSVGEQMIS
jgi:hypothetical protein